ncbi:MAG: O-antigen ligase family protein [Phascolarctobacterium sp.]|nr:O-antigen ligase family protein [Phascolarctobacterium sp.]
MTNLRDRKREAIPSVVLFLYSLSLAWPQYNAFVSIAAALAIVVIICFYRKEILVKLAAVPRLLYWAFGVFVCAVLVASLAIHDSASIAKAQNIIYWMLPFFLMYLLASFEKNKWLAAYYGFHLALLISNIIGLAEFIKTHGRVTGPYGHPNHFAMMLDILLPYCLFMAVNYYRSKNNRLLACGMLANSIWGVATLFLTASRGAILGILLGAYFCLILYGFRKILWQKMALIIVLLTCSLGYLGYNNMQNFHRSYDYERILLMESSYNMWNDHKVFGVGLANWEKEYQKKYISPQAKEKELDMPHNIIAYYFSTTGLIGGIGFCILMLGIMAYLIKNSLGLSLNVVFCYAMLLVAIAVTIHGLVDVGITMKSAARFFYGCLGLTVGVISCLDDKK